MATKITPGAMGVVPWKVMESDTERVKEGFIKLKQALAEDERRERERPSGLPKDWRNRVFRLKLVIDPLSGKVINSMDRGMPDNAATRVM